ncbi:MAG: 2-oxoacid:acceptor oxidoreductase subunit alpha [Burkholderiales bacterium]|nr:2-oxoacid:acceptor oxidoreductase subunit alpha [Burkholderiales bacterium]
MSKSEERAGRRSVSVAITGSGGAGVMTAGNMLLEAAARAGWYGLMVRSSGPQIRGGEAAALLRIASHPVDSLDDGFDVLVAVDWQNVHRFADEIPLGPQSVIVGDPDQGDPPEVYLKSGARYGKLAMKATAKSIPGSWPNMLALGAAAGLVGIPVDAVKAVVGQSLKKSEAVAASVAAVEAGMKFAAELGSAAHLAPAPAKHDNHWLLTGNQAAGFGAIRGGVRFVAAYPITPATELLEYMAPALTQVGGVLVQAEDELASINMIIGASYGGVPSLTATAGPGLSLMVEALGLAVAAEVPIVVVDVMRGGPSTGIPAKSEQSDLSMAVNGLHGDAPRLVLAPNSIADCVTTTQWAVHLAEQMQAPAIVLSDQFFGQARAVVPRPANVPYVANRATVGANAEGFKRYALTESGISPMSIPGTPGVTYTADGLEHNERGIPSSGATDHRNQLAKRERKLAQGDYAAHWADLEGEGDIAVVTFGSSTGPVREALARARADGVNVRLVSMRLLAPAQPQRMAEALAGVKRVLVVEQNWGGQLHRYLRSDFEIPGEVRSFRQPGPLPIRPAALHRELVEWSRA